MAVTAVADPRSAVRAALVALRPRQWTKNLLLFAGVLFAGKIADTSLWLDAGVGFVAYCAASSASYLANDVRDAPLDREHPAKRLRPIASGELPARVALVLAAVLALAAFGLVASLGLGSVAFMAAFLALQVAYSAGLKQVVLVDVMVIAGLFVIRASAGAEAVNVRISPWLLICTGLLALFLALAKRRAELVLVGATATPGRPVLEGYSLALVDQLVSIVAASTVIAYCAVHVQRPGLEGDDGDGAVRDLRRVPLPAAAPSPRSRRGAGERPAHRRAADRDARGVGGNQRRDPRR